MVFGTATKRTAGVVHRIGEWRENVSGDQPPDLLRQLEIEDDVVEGSAATTPCKAPR